MTTDPQTPEPTEPDDPAAYALARHLADHPVSTIQAAFRYLNTPVAIELEPAAVPPTGRAGLRELIDEALLDHLSRTADIRPGKTGQLAFMPEITDPERQRIADAVLAALFGPIPNDTDTATWTAIRAIQLMNEAGQQRDASAEPHRLALSDALGLGTSAPWDAIRERAAELAGQPVAVDRAAVLREEAARIRAHCPDHLDSDSAEGAWLACHCAVADDMERRLAAETQGEARPARHTWEVESPRRDNWASWGATYDERDWARERYESAIGNAPARPFRLVRATTTYAVEAEHQPAAETPDAPRREPHPTEADLRHALAVAAKFHGRDATVPVDPAASRTVEYRHTCHDQTSAPGPDYECQWCSTLPESLPAVVAEPGKEA